MEKFLCSSQSDIHKARFTYLCDLFAVWYFVVNLTEIVVARFKRKEGRQPNSSETEPELFPLRCTFLRLKTEFYPRNLSCLLELNC